MIQKYKNLQAEMKRHSITVSDIATLIGKSEIGVSKNLNGSGGDFRVQEALTIHKVLFPYLDIDYLFRKGE